MRVPHHEEVQSCSAEPTQGHQDSQKQQRQGILGLRHSVVTLDDQMSRKLLTCLFAQTPRAADSANQHFQKRSSTMPTVLISIEQGCAVTVRNHPSQNHSWTNKAGKIFGKSVVVKPGVSVPSFVWSVNNDA
jgi:hypothetical protein